MYSLHIIMTYGNWGRGPKFLTAGISSFKLASAARSLRSFRRSMVGWTCLLVVVSLLFIIIICITSVDVIRTTMNNNDTTSRHPHSSLEFGQTSSLWSDHHIYSSTLVEARDGWICSSGSWGAQAQFQWCQMCRAWLVVYPHCSRDIWLFGCKSHADFVTPCNSPSHQGKFFKVSCHLSIVWQA